MKSEATAIRTALLAVSILTATVGQALAQTPPAVEAPAAHDLIAGFRSSDGGQTNSYLIRLGNYSTQFSGVAEGGSLVLNLGAVGQDLQNEFGSNWFNRSDLYWGIFGTNSGTVPLIYGSKARPATSTPATPWASLSDDARRITGGEIVSVLYLIRGYTGRPSTSNSAYATFQPNIDKEASSYNFQVAPVGNDFGSLSGWTSIENNFSSTSSKALDVFRHGSNGAVLRVGTFTIASSGVITFSKPSSANPNADTDGDGYTDAQETIAGTSPTNGADFFHVSSTVKASGNTSVSFAPKANRTYQLQYSADLSTGSWVEITSAAPAPPATLARLVTTASPPSSYSFQDIDPTRLANAKGFYRVVVSQN